MINRRSRDQRGGQSCTGLRRICRRCRNLVKRSIFHTFSSIHKSLTYTRPKRIMGWSKRDNGRIRRRVNVEPLWRHASSRQSDYLDRKTNNRDLLLGEANNRAVDIPTRHHTRAAVLSLRRRRKCSRFHLVWRS